MQAPANNTGIKPAAASWWTYLNFITLVMVINAVAMVWPMVTTAPFPMLGVRGAIARTPPWLHVTLCSVTILAGLYLLYKPRRHSATMLKWFHLGFSVAGLALMTFISMFYGWSFLILAMAAGSQRSSLHPKLK
jgi:hypothetical protein